MRKLVSLVAATVLLSSCYHATVDTGLAPSPQVVEQQWAHSWVYGLVPPTSVETQQKCAKGPSKVETQLSFTNQLVGILTGGIYTPMSVKVTCAS